MKVVVLAGGRSSEHDVSMDSAAAVVEALVAGGHEVATVRLERDGTWTGPDGVALALAPGGGLLGADVVFPVLHGPFGEDVDDAARLIEGAGFKVRRREQKVDSPEGDGVVLTQNPPSGEKRDKGSRVTLIVGKFEPENLDPDPAATPTPSPTP